MDANTTPRPTSSYGMFRGDTDRNEVQIDLVKFVDLLKETNELKEKIRDLESEKKSNRFISVMHLAEAVDSWRIFPRIFISIYMFLLYRSVLWFMELPDPNSQQAALISTIVGAGAAWFGLYAGTGTRKLQQYESAERKYERS